MGVGPRKQHFLGFLYAEYPPYLTLIYLVKVIVMGPEMNLFPCVKLSTWRTGVLFCLLSSMLQNCTPFLCLAQRREEKKGRTPSLNTHIFTSKAVSSATSSSQSSAALSYRYQLTAQEQYAHWWVTIAAARVCAKHKSNRCQVEAPLKLWPFIS